MMSTKKYRIRLTTDEQQELNALARIHRRTRMDGVRTAEGGG